MTMKHSLLGTFAYALVTFPLAVVWHVALFEDIYQRFGYFNGEPNFFLGLVTIVAQGAILSFLYPHVSFAGQGIVKGVKYGLVGGILVWTTHVLAFVAKQNVADAWSFVAMESVYLLLQFSIFGLLIGLIFRGADSSGSQHLRMVPTGR